MTADLARVLASREAPAWAAPPGRPPELAEVVWQRAVAVGRPSGQHDDRFLVALDLLRVAHHSPATMLHALTLGTSHLHAHPDDALAREGVAVLGAAIAFLGVKPRRGEIALAVKPHRVERQVARRTGHGAMAKGGSC